MDLTDEYEIEYDEWDDDWAAQHPADDPDVMQPVVVLEKMSTDRLSCVERLEGIRHLDDTARTPSVRPYRCEICQARFTAKKSLQVHMRRHDVAKPFCCTYCPRRFTYRHALTVHERVHTVDTPFACHVCGQRFRLSKTLAVHMRDVHAGFKPLECAVCNDTFTSSLELQQHEAEHGVVPPPQLPRVRKQQPPAEQSADDYSSKNKICYVCDKVFPTPSAMFAHIRTHKLGCRFRCRQCPLHFASWLSLRSHLKVHNKPSTHKCKLCPLRFACRSSLFSHLKTHDRQAGKDYVRCSKCLERFVGRKSLYAHFKKHKAEEEGLEEAEADSPVDQGEVQSQVGNQSKDQTKDQGQVKMYQCPTCPLVFDKYWNHWNHRKNECPGVPRPLGAKKGFLCGKCGVRCSTKKKLYWHARSHNVKAEPVPEQDVNLEVEPEAHSETGSAEASATTNEEAAIPQRVFRCGKCSQPFPDRRSLHVHSKTHSGAMVVMGVLDDPMQGAAGSEPHESDLAAGPVPVKKSKGKQSKVLKNTFRCSKCSRSFWGRKAFMKHHKANLCGNVLLEQTSDAPKANRYRCRKCSEVFPDKKSQMVHHEKVHAGLLEPVIKRESETRPKKYRCSKCPEVFPDTDSHWAHYKEHMTEAIHEAVVPDATEEPLPATPALRCRKCPEVFQDRVSHWWHYRTHMDCEKAEDTCTAPPSSIDPLAKDDCDPLAKYFRCSLCPRIFPDESSHWLHFREHLNSDPFVVVQNSVEDRSEAHTCHTCSETFSDERSHWLHFKVHADIPAQDLYEIVKPAVGVNEGQYRCSKCTEVFVDLESHWWHYRTHSQPDEVNICDEYLSTKEGEEGSKILKCSKCPEVFDSERSHWWHYRVHATDPANCFEVVRRRPEYRCVKCAQGFPDAASHWLHYRDHFEPDAAQAKLFFGRVDGEADMQYRCSRCPDLFPDVAAHWVHFRVHFETNEPDERVCHEMEIGEDSGGQREPVAQEDTAFRCIKCDQASDDLESHWWHYRSHLDVDDDMEAEEDVPGALRCLECSLTFPDAESHWTHYRQHVQDAVCEEVEEQVDVKPKSYPCAKCPEVFPDRRSRFLHCAVHVTPRAASAPSQAPKVDSSQRIGYQCNPCREIFLDTESHWWHYKTVHAADDEYVGPETYQIVELTDDPSEDPLAKTRRSTSIKCSKCSETFADRKMLFTHRSTVHANEGTPSPASSVCGGEDRVVPKTKGFFHCSKCPSVFPDRKSHWWHYRIHTDASAATALEVPAEEAMEDMDATEATEATEGADGGAKPKSKSYRCSKCPEEFPDRKSHYAHCKAQHWSAPEPASEALDDAADASSNEAQPQTKEFHCSKCPEVFSDRKSHWWHYRIHTDTEFGASLPEEEADEKARLSSGKYHCSKCPESFPDRKTHMVHWKAVHRRNSDVSVKSEVTEVVAVKSKKSKKHPKGKNVDMFKAYKCTLCARWFKFKINLLNHLKWTHANATPPRQDGEVTCARPAATASPCRTLSTSSVGRSFKCSKCSARFGNRSVLWAHFKTHKQGGRTYSCTECDAQFNARGALRAHAELHRKTEAVQKEQEGAGSSAPAPEASATPGTPAGGIACDKCDLVFQSRTGLGAHQRAHSPHKPFKCQQCGKAFTMGCNLLRHIKSHLKQAYKCRHCRQGFDSSAARKEHYRSAHPPDSMES